MSDSTAVRPEPVEGRAFPVRQAMAEVKPYIPGKPIAEVQRELGLKKVLKLASNENPLGPSPKAMRAYRAAAKTLHIYPEGSSPLLRQALEKRLGLPEGSIVLGNGSDEVSRMLCEVLLEPGDEGVCSANGFIRFRQCVGLMGGKTVLVPEKDFRHDLPAMAAAVTPKTKLIFVATPNNPTGAYATEGEVKDFLGRVPERVVVILDEAYYEYARPRKDYPDSLPDLLRAHRNLMVLRTFSKAYGLAGLRVGYGAAHPELVRWIDRVRMPFNVCVPAQVAALAGLSDESFVRKSVALVEKERPKVAEGLSKLGFTVWPSSANFVMASGQRPGRELFQRLLKLGVIVRPLDEYGLTHHIRVSIGSPAQNAALLKAVARSLSA